MLRPVILKTGSCLLVLGIIATTCIRLELARRMMILEYLKFEYEKERLEVERGEDSQSKDDTR